MNVPRLTLALTLLNLALLAFVPIQARRLAAAGGEVLRGQALELVDGRGRVRSRIHVEADGEVVLRLLDQDGKIRVKLGASRSGSGLLLADETSEPGVHMVARRVATAERPLTTGITVKAAGRERRFRP